MLIDEINYIESKGFDAQPVREPKGIRFVIWKDEKILKIGQKYYKDLMTGQKEVYHKLYKAITK